MNILGLFGFRWGTRKKQLEDILKGQQDLMVNVEGLATSITNLNTKVDLLIAAHQDPTSQNAIDEAAKEVDAIAAKIDQVLTPAADTPTA